MRLNYLVYEELAPSIPYYLFSISTRRSSISVTIYMRNISTIRPQLNTRLKGLATLSFCKICFGLFWLLLATVSYAQDTPPSDDEYQQALRLIAQGQKQEASYVLQRVIRTHPDHAGAWLDLALLRCEMGQAEEAELLFAELTARFQPPPRILKIIALQLAKGCIKVEPPSGHLSLMLGRGFDNNVNQGSNTPNFVLGSGNSRIQLQLLPEFLPQRDQFTIVSAEYVHNTNVHGTTGFVQFQARKNDILTRYDATVISAGVEQSWHLRDWQTRGSVTLSALSLGGALYQKQSHLQMLVSPPLALPQSLHVDLTAGLTNATFTTKKNLNSKIWELNGQLSYAAKRANLQLLLGYLSDRASNTRPGGNRQGWSGGLQSKFRITANVTGELGLSRQTWNSDLAYSPGLIEQRRKQTTDIARLAITIPIAAHHAVRIDLRKVQNKENISIFQYNNQQLLFSWLWRNF